MLRLVSKNGLRCAKRKRTPCERRLPKWSRVSASRESHNRRHLFIVFENRRCTSEEVSRCGNLTRPMGTNFIHNSAPLLELRVFCLKVLDCRSIARRKKKTRQYDIDTLNVSRINYTYRHYRIWGRVSTRYHKTSYRMRLWKGMFVKYDWVREKQKQTKGKRECYPTPVSFLSQKRKAEFPAEFVQQKHIFQSSHRMLRVKASFISNQFKRRYTLGEPPEKSDQVAT